MTTPELPDGSSIWALGASALASLVYLRRFMSRQRVDLKKDDAEANLIKTLQEERDKAMAAAEKAWETRAEDAKLIGELTGEVRACREIIERLQAKVDELQNGMHEMSMEMQRMRNDCDCD